MIKEIADEFDVENRKNVLNLLNKIKDLDYTVTGVYKDILYYESKKEYFKVYLFFSSFNYHRIIKIEISKLGTCGYDTIVKIETGLNTKGVTTISEELYKKYWGNK